MRQRIGQSSTRDPPYHDRNKGVECTQRQKM